MTSLSLCGLAVSVVSHGHGALVQRLLDDLAQLSSATVRRVVLTLNRPEAPPLPPAGGWPFALQLRCNTRPLGFGTNHNRALAGAAEPFVCVLNPDIALTAGDPFAALVQAAGAPGIGCAYPVQVDARGRAQDSERALPTPRALCRRHMGGRKETTVDWVNAACLVLPQPVWQSLGGFDEAFFMYCEDVDLCLRLRLAGFRLARAPAQLMHAGQRASARRLNHLRWHLQSLWRLWQSPVYQQAQQLPAAQRSAIGGSIDAP
ncbi:glycosyltransferase [Verminephrobacter aporrectodeae]|uniref:glycosyltransferase n=1 Tax=Verminephrobacter aporrectodeae TaxID=1110389 RepID=UPI0022432778|nr:glycosyltransferase [Verminephrobacter aporrectodeae]